MKRVLLGMLAVMMLVMSACGDSSVTVVVPLQPPSITFLDVALDRVTEVAVGTVDFIAPDEDIATMTVTVIDSGGVLISRTTTLIDLPNVIEGTIPFRIGYRNRAFLVDTLTLSVFLTDFNGLTSNVDVRTFLVP